MKAENTSLAVGDKRINDNQEIDTIGILEVFDVESEEELNAPLGHFLSVASLKSRLNLA